MSFNNLGFNAKATPTTSTTTTSSRVSSSGSKPSSKQQGVKDVSSPLRVLAKVSEPITSVASISPATTSGTQAGSPGKDLKGIFKKYEVETSESFDSDNPFSRVEKEGEKELEEDSEPESQSSEKQEKDGGVQDQESANEQESVADKGKESPAASLTQSADSAPAPDAVHVNGGTRADATAAGVAATSAANAAEPPSLEQMTIQPYVPEISESSHASETKSPSAEHAGDILTCDNAGPTEVVLPDQTAQPREKPASRLVRNNSIAKASGVVVNPSEQHQQSHRPFDFQTFLGHLRKKSADPLVRYIRSFLVSFSRQATTMSAAQMIKATRNFKAFIEGKFRAYEPFASMDPVDVENSVEGVEKLIMNRLYDFCFSPVAVKNSPKASASLIQDVQEDAAFSLQVEKFSWVSGIHLDVDLDEISRRKRENSKDDIDYIAYAIKELNKINSYRAPRDKIICILNACKIIFNLLRVTNQETNADSFIPLLILIILKSKTENIISNLRYIERFRGEDWLYHGETSYYLSTMQGAVTFIQNIKKEDLTIDQEHYDAHMEAWEAEMRQRPARIQPQVLEVDEQSQAPTTRVMSPSNVLMASAEMFSKSISNFMSPTDTPEAETPQDEPQNRPEFTDEQVGEVLGQLAEIFPSLDKAVMRDVIIMNKADLEQSLDGCLQLVNET